LLDGQVPPTLIWSNVGGVISIKAKEILGILEGRTRIKAATLQELYPVLFEKTPNPGAEYNIPLQSVVMQLKGIFAGISEETGVENFDTPFGPLVCEDEARFKDRQVDRPEEEKSTVDVSRATPATFHDENGDNAKVLRSNGTRPVPGDHTNPPEETQPPMEKVCSELEPRNVVSGNSQTSSYARKSHQDNIRRQGHVNLQELYLTDEPLDASKVADLVLQLPRVTGVAIMLSYGSLLGGGLSGGISETLLSLTPDFVKHLLGFTQSIQGGPTKFATIPVQARQISLSIGGDVFILAEHEGKNLPPGVRERLVATAQALDKIYSSQS
jgi:hypothetical protein